MNQRCIVVRLSLLTFCSILALGSLRDAIRAAPEAQGPKAIAAATQLETVGPKMATQQAVCRWAAVPPKLDGKIDDPCWQHAAAIEQFSTYWIKTPRTGTRAYLVWDEDALYLPATLTDAEVRSFGTQRTTRSGMATSSSCSSSPTADKPAYYEFQANPRGVIFELAFPKRGEYPDPFSKGPALGTRRSSSSTARSTTPATRPRLDRRRSHPLDGLRAYRRQTQARRLVALRDLPVRLWPQGNRNRS